MSELRATRQALADAFTAAEVVPTASVFMPARITPPLAVVVPGSPYATAGDVVGSLTVRVDANLIVGALNNDTSTDTLDTLVDDAIVAGINAGFRFIEAGEPYGIESGGARYLAIALTFTKPGVRL